MKNIDLKLNILDKNPLKICQIISKHGGKARIIGGAVRDHLLKYKVSDYDLTTDFSPEQITEIFSSESIKVIPTGLSHGTVSVLLEGNLYEITTLRKDVATDGRHAEVEFTNNFEEDALRRDFTLNALSYDPIEEKIYDYTSGYDDLRAIRVRFIGAPDARIKEDYLRIIRFFRFSQKYAKDLDLEGYEACMKYASALKGISLERINQELERIFTYNNILFKDKRHARKFNIVEIFIKRQIIHDLFFVENNNEQLNEILSPSMKVDLLSKMYEFSNSVSVDILPVTYFALLLPISISCNIKNLLKVKFSKKQAIEINFIASTFKVIEATDDNELKFILNHACVNSKFKELFNQYSIFFTAILGFNKNHIKDISQLEQKALYLMKNPKPEFPVKASDIIDLGFKFKEISTWLSHLEKIWIESDFALDKKALLGKIENK